MEFRPLLPKFLGRIDNVSREGGLHYLDEIHLDRDTKVFGRDALIGNWP